MTWDDVAKIFNLEGPFESGREETSKRPNDAAKFYTYSYITNAISNSKANPDLPGKYGHEEHMDQKGLHHYLKGEKNHMTS